MTRGNLVQRGVARVGRRARGAVVMAVIGTLLSTGIAASSSPETPPLRVALELDGLFAGWLSSAQGGVANGPVVVESPDSNHVVHKHIAGVKYEDISLAFGTGMDSHVYQWLQDSMKGSLARKSGAIIAADYNYKVLSRLSFSNGLITEIGMPALDAASKDAAKMTIKITPEFTRLQYPSNQTYPSSPRTQKKWLPANFRFSLDGVATDATSSRISSIDSFTWKQAVDGGKPSAPPTISNLVINMDEYLDGPLFKWFDIFIVRGQNTQADERSAHIDYLDADGSTALFTLTLSNVGIFKLTPQRVETDQLNLRRVKAEMYVEQMVFDFSSAASS